MIDHENINISPVSLSLAAENVLQVEENEEEFNIQDEMKSEGLTEDAENDNESDNKSSPKKNKMSLDDYRKMKCEPKKATDEQAPRDEDEPETPEIDEDQDSSKVIKSDKKCSQSKDLIAISTDEEGDHLNDDESNVDMDDALLCSESEEAKLYNRSKLSPIEWDRISDEEEEEEEEGENNVVEEEPYEANEPQRKKNRSGDKTELRLKAHSPTPPPNLPKHIKYLFKDTRYFLIKSNNFENVAIAKSKCVWSTPRSNEYRLNMAFAECRNAILIFSVKESGHFQGYARLASLSDKKESVNWVLPAGFPVRALSDPFKIDWISKTDLSFTKTSNLINPWNERKPVKIGRDGQEIEPNCGEALCRMFFLDKDCDLDDVVDRAKKTKRDPKLIRMLERQKEGARPNRGTPRFNRGNDRFRPEERYHSRYHHNPPIPMLTPDIFLNGNYQDYIHHQAEEMSRRGYHYPNFPYPQIYPHDHMLPFDNHQRAYPPNSRDGELKYEQRVTEFLRGMEDRDRQRSRNQNSSQRNRSRSRSRSKGHSGDRERRARHYNRSPGVYSRSHSRERR